MYTAEDLRTVSDLTNEFRSLLERTAADLDRHANKLDIILQKYIEPFELTPEQKAEAVQIATDWVAAHPEVANVV